MEFFFAVILCCIVKRKQEQIWTKAEGGVDGQTPHFMLLLTKPSELIYKSLLWIKQ